MIKYGKTKSVIKDILAEHAGKPELKIIQIKLIYYGLDKNDGKWTSKGI